MHDCTVFSFITVCTFSKQKFWYIEGDLRKHLKTSLYIVVTFNILLQFFIGQNQNLILQTKITACSVHRNKGE